MPFLFIYSVVACCCSLSSLLSAVFCMEFPILLLKFMSGSCCCRLAGVRSTDRTTTNKQTKSYLKYLVCLFAPTMFPRQCVPAVLSSKHSRLPAALVGLLVWSSGGKVWNQEKNESKTTSGIYFHNKPTCVKQMT